MLPEADVRTIGEIECSVQTVQQHRIGIEGFLRNLIHAGGVAQDDFAYASALPRFADLKEALAHILIFDFCRMPEQCKGERLAELHCL